MNKLDLASRVDMPDNTFNIFSARHEQKRDLSFHVTNRHVIWEAVPIILGKKIILSLKCVKCFKLFIKSLWQTKSVISHKLVLCLTRRPQVTYKSTRIWTQATDSIDLISQPSSLVR